jgi:hypothetical protein
MRRNPVGNARRCTRARQHPVTAMTWGVPRDRRSYAREVVGLSRNFSAPDPIYTRQRSADFLFFFVFLVLLCHKRPQEGQHGSSRASARAMSDRMVAMDAGLWRSGRTGTSPWAETFGYGSGSEEG